VTRLLIVRHGYVEGIEPPRFRGRIELALTPLGVRQAAAVAARIAAAWRPAAVLTSPLGRCVATGAAIAAATGAPARVLESLADLDYGAWTWKTHAEARADDPALYAAWHAAPATVRFPGGESLQDLVARAADALRLAAAEFAGETVVLVTHDSVGRALLALALDQPLSAHRRLDLSPCGISEIVVEGGELRVLGVNATEHLAGA
jgi:probable phosphoglycerate mutase